MKFETINELKLKVSGAKDQVLVEEDCCTCINILLKNDGQVMTSFLGAHNPEIIRLLEKAQKLYFKEIKKTLKAKYFENEQEPCACGDECHCHSDHEHCNCGCEEHSHKAEEKHECNCGCEEHSKEKQPKKKAKSKTKN